MSVDHEPTVLSRSSAKPQVDTPYSRKVSIVEHHIHDKGHENHAFESPARSRKVSATSEYAEIGPVRKKSILHHHISNAFENTNGVYDAGKVHNADRKKKISTTESVNSKYSAYSKTSAYSRARLSDDVNDDKSWWYSFCIKCRTQENHPSWHPGIWPKICPYPFCPTYRQFSRIIAVGLIGLLSWCVLYALIGDIAAPPHGIIYQLILLSICAHFGGWIISLTTLPALIGMLFTGLLFQNVGVVNINEDFSEITKVFRNIALVIILIRAGLDLDPSALRRLKFTVMKLGLIPWITEASVTAVFSRYFLDMPWNYAVLLGSIIAAVSPAVVVPCLFRLRSKGYGVAKGIPTLIIAIAGIDDALSVAMFGVIKSIMFSSSSVTSVILQGPVSILGGLGFGILWGILCNYIPEKHDPFLIPLRILLLLVGGLITVFGSDLIGYSGAGPLACVSTAFVCLVCWTKQGWEIDDNPATTAFEIFWMIFEPVLFGITGAQINLNQMDGAIVSMGLGILAAAIIIRIVITILVGIRCQLNTKEKVFIAFALMSKATVQAALAPVALATISNESSVEHEYAEKILMICILSIMLSAPIGAIMITILGPRLLTKTKFPVISDGWRQSHRPSIRDISIIDEEEEKADIESVISDSPSSKDRSSNKLENTL